MTQTTTRYQLTKDRKVLETYDTLAEADHAAEEEAFSEWISGDWTSRADFRRRGPTIEVVEVEVEIDEEDGQ